MPEPDALFWCAVMSDIGGWAFNKHPPSPFSFPLFASA